MSRLAWLLSALVAILIVVLWWFLLWTPTSEEIEQLRADTEIAQGQTAQQRAEEARLRQVRETSPEGEAQLASSRVIIPPDAALPAMLRQIQLASDGAGTRLVSIAPSRPTEVADVPGGLSSIQLNFNVEGTYFQIVDLTRRLEDPQIAGRGLLWRNVAFSVGEYPDLNVTLSAEVFARTGTQAPPEPVEEPTEGDDGTAEDGDEQRDDEEVQG